jgi:HD-like signal output (HDOD) protein
MKSLAKVPGIIEFPGIRKQRLRLIQNYINRIPSLSTTVRKVLEICNSPKTTANDLNRVISLDPVLAGRVLKVVNSVYYSLPKKVSSLTRAIIMLGPNTVVNLIVSSSVLDKLYRKDSFRSLSMEEFWTHSFCVGVTAKYLATIKSVSGTEHEEYFLAGLLHDLGKIPLNSCFADDYKKALELAKLEQGPLHRAENMILGIDHCVVGKLIAEKWQLNETLMDSLCHHHDPDKVREENRLLISIVALANVFADIFEIGSSGDNFPDDPMLIYLLQQVGVSWRTLSDFTETVLDEIEKARIFLQIVKKG